MELKVTNSQVTMEAPNGSLFEATGSANAQGRLLGIHSAPGGEGGESSLPGSGQARRLAGRGGKEE